MDATLIKNLKRDGKGNFSYKSNDGAEIWVTAGTKSAEPLEAMWGVCQELHAAQLAKRNARSRTNPLLAPIRWLTDWISSLFKGAPKTGTILQRRSQPGWTNPEVGNSSHNGSDGRNPATSQRSTPHTGIKWRDLPPEGRNSAGRQKLTPSRASSSAAAPTASKPPEPQAEASMSDQVETFGVEEIKFLGEQGYHVRFADGIEVTLPPESEHAKLLGSAFRQLSSVKKTLDDLNPNQAGPGKEQELYSGQIVPMALSAGGKERYGFEHKGQIHPLKLTLRETVVLRTLLKSGKLKGVAATVEPATVATIRGLQLGDHERERTVSFRAFVEQVRKDPTLAEKTEPAVTSTVAESPAPEAARDNAVPSAVSTQQPSASELTPAPVSTPESSRSPVAETQSAAEPPVHEEEGVRFEDLPPPRTSEPSAPAESPFAGLSVVVADGNEALIAQLNKLGCKASRIPSGVSAKEFLENCMVSKTWSDVVILPPNMPDIAGFDAARYQTSADERGTIPQFVAVVEQANAETMQQAATAGIAALLPLPINGEVVEQVLKAIRTPAVKPVSAPPESAPQPTDSVNVPEAEYELPPN